MRRPLRILLAVCLLLVAVTPAARHRAAREVPVVVDTVDVLPVSQLDASALRDLDDWIAWAAAQPPPPPPAPPEGNLRAQAPQSRRSYSGDPGAWDRVADCESGGDWAANTGNGYFGGLQMDMEFWRSYGGPEFAERPDLASREQQIIVAERARDTGRGYRPWPVCGARA